MAPLVPPALGSLCKPQASSSSVRAYPDPSERGWDEDVEAERRCPSSRFYRASISTSCLVYTILTACMQKRGWEPEAILNWLALAGWGAQHEVPATPDAPHPSKPRLIQEAPDSTRIMTLPEMIQQVRKLEFLLLRCLGADTFFSLSSRRSHNAAQALTPRNSSISTNTTLCKRHPRQRA